MTAGGWEGKKMERWGECGCTRRGRASAHCPCASLISGIDVMSTVRVNDTQSRHRAHHRHANSSGKTVLCEVGSLKHCRECAVKARYGERDGDWSDGREAVTRGHDRLHCIQPTQVSPMSACDRTKHSANISAAAEVSAQRL